jgi:hypothetical protein
VQTPHIIRQIGALLRCAILTLLALVFLSGFLVCLLALTATHFLFCSSPQYALED